MIVGSQIAGSEPRLFLVYPEDNFIEASDETPYFQSLAQAWSDSIREAIKALPDFEF